jgi:hypothetical protein
MSFVEESPAQTFIEEEAGPTQSVILSQVPAQSIAVSAQAIQLEEPAVEAATGCQFERWNDYSEQNIELAFPELPQPDYTCYQPPQVPPGQTRFLKVDEAAHVKNLEQNFNDVRTAIRENNTHVQRNRTQITNISRNHNHLLRIVTNENNFEHNLTNKIVRVADTHRQKIENVAGETRNFKDFKQTQRVEAQGCRRADVAVVNGCAPAPAAVAYTAPAVTAQAISIAPGTTSVLAASTPTAVKILQSGVTLSTAPTVRSQILN